MPEHLRALVVIVFLTTCAFSLVAKLATTITANYGDYKSRRNLWFLLTIAAFLLQSFWLFAILAGLVLAFSKHGKKAPVALFLFLLFLIPPNSIPIPGLGLINYLFELNHIRLLALAILFPAALSLLQSSGTVKLGKLASDKYFLAFLFLSALLNLRATTFTDTLRQCFYLCTDVFLPYFVASRSLRSLEEFKEALFYLLTAVIALAIIAVFETSRHWLLYSALIPAMGMPAEMISSYLGRADTLRASATTGQAIVLGYVILVGIGSYLYLQRHAREQMIIRRSIWLLLIAGLIAPLSRGPWVGAVVLLIIYVITGPKALRNLTIIFFGGIACLLAISILPGGERVIDLLPFIGETDKGNITYRQDLINNALIVIERNFWFGSSDYRLAPEMEAMRQGQGIIDIVNTYINITLQYGIVGLSLFVGFFASILLGLKRSLTNAAASSDDLHQLGRALFASMIAMLVTIFTVSSISVIPSLYWIFSGISVAYIQVVSAQTPNQKI